MSMTAWVERQADGALEAGGHGNTRTVGRDSPHDALARSTTNTSPRGIDHDAGTSTKRRPGLEGRERAERLLGAALGPSRRA